MNRLLSLIMMIMLVVPAMSQIKDRDFKTKLKYAKKEAKEYENAGWYVAPGDLPLEKQLEGNYTKALEEDDNGFPKYLVASGNALAGTQSAAKMQATELAKLELAGQLSSQIAATIDNQVANNQLNSEEAATLQKMVAASKNVVATKLGRVITMVEMYKKDSKTKNVECAVRIGYSQEMARKMALEAMQGQLQGEANIAADKLEKLFGF